MKKEREVGIYDFCTNQTKGQLIVLSKKELIYLKVYNRMFACVETIEHDCSLEIKYKWMLLSITNTKREYNIRDCEPIIHCKRRSWFRFPENVFWYLCIITLVKHFEKLISWFTKQMIRLTYNMWRKQLIYDFAVLPQLGICVIFLPSFIYWSRIKHSMKTIIRIYPYLVRVIHLES